MFLVTMALAAVGVVGVAGTAQAYDITCGAYGQTPSFACVSSTSYTGQQPWGYPVDANGHNCTNYASYRLWQNGVANPGNLGNAKDWDDNASRYGFLVNNTPAVGSIAVWEVSTYAGTAGHVAYVEAVTSTYIDISEDNYGGTTMRKRFYVGQANWPNHFIHFKDMSSGGGTTVSPPPDTDVDGVPDGADVCKDQPGMDYLNGCVQQHAKLNGDFNGDGKLDVAAFYRYPERGNAVGLFVWYGNGDGTFGGPQLGWYTSTGWDGTHVIVAGAGDFNGDGKADVAAFYRYDNTTVRLFTWISQTSGTFADPVVGNVQSAFEGANLTPVGVGDFNGDGKLDVEAFYRYPERGNALSLFMFSGNGDGTFNDAALNWYNATGWEGLHVISAGAGDFNQDGYADVVAFYEYPDTSIKMFEWFGNSAGTFSGPTIAFTGTSWEGYHLIPVGVGDFDGNGKLDVAAFYRYPERGNAVGLFVWYGNGDGTFGSPELPWYTSSGWEGTHVISAGVGDYDHNGQSDVTAFYEYPDTSIKMFEWHNEHWGSFPTTDPTIQFTGAGWEGFHLMA